MRSRKHDTAASTVLTASAANHFLPSRLFVCTLASAAIGIALGGCGGGYRAKQNQMAVLCSEGRYGEARDVAFAPETESAYGSNNTLLLELERGTTSLAADSPQAALDALNKAEELCAWNYDKSAGDVFVQWVVNDASTTYLAKPSEDLYVNTFKALSHLQMGKIENGAAVECRRQMDKQQNLRALHDKFLSSVKSGTDKELVAKASSNTEVHLDGTGEFVDSPLGCFVSAVTYMHHGEPDAQRFACRRLMDTIQRYGPAIGNVQADHFAHLSTMQPQDGNVMIVAFSGRAPELYSQDIDLPIIDSTYSIPFPKCRRIESPITSAELVFADGTRQALDLVEDMSAVAAENFKRNEDTIYYRTLLRIAAKAAIVTVTAIGVQQSTESDGWTAAVAAAGLLYIVATENADLRSWVTIPGQARVKVLKLPPGEHDLKVVYQGNGSTHEVAWQKVNVANSGLTTLIARCPQ